MTIYNNRNILFLDQSNNFVEYLSRLISEPCRIVGEKNKRQFRITYG